MADGGKVTDLAPPTLAVPLPVRDRRLDLQPGPATRRGWLTDVWFHRDLLATLARKDFQVRYKRATFGVLWAVAVPLIQAAVLAVIFSKFVPVRAGHYGAFVVSGLLPYTYFSQSITAGATAIVDGSGLADKVWFPRAVLSMASAGANLYGLVISLVIMIGLLPLLDADLGVRLLLLIPATALLIAFTTALSLVLSALHVYFRDVRFLVQAGLLVLFYVTPIAYPLEAVGRPLSTILECNPLTGILTLFRMAVGASGPWRVAVGVSVASTLALCLTAIEVHRRRDRLFIDLL